MSCRRFVFEGRYLPLSRQVESTSMFLSTNISERPLWPPRRPRSKSSGGAPRSWGSACSCPRHDPVQYPSCCTRRGVGRPQGVS
jgi:hypothetical protein